MKSEFDKLFEEMGTWQLNQLEKEHGCKKVKGRIKKSNRWERIMYPLVLVTATALIFIMLFFIIMPKSPSMESIGHAELQKDVKVEKIYAQSNEKVDTFKAYSTWQLVWTGSSTDAEMMASATGFIHAIEYLPLSKEKNVEWAIDAVFVLSNGTEQPWKFGYSDMGFIAMDMKTGLRYVDEGKGILTFLLFLPTGPQNSWRGYIRVIGLLLLLNNVWLARVVCRFSKEELKDINEKKKITKGRLRYKITAINIVKLIILILLLVVLIYNGMPRIIFIPVVLLLFVVIIYMNGYERKVEGDTRNEKMKKVDRWATVFLLMGALLMALGF
ncbi:hypothetical protein AEA09_15660 [Lysinibacillus contaminans]|uniref:Uncharacterized protein n=1 Tax=Lysinibacillus contaminans TaxID=1293441 RepID=A0ABR5JY30_9BACI|nr:hypothetical protein [Lysinibacillus contaminans]KOS66936.1 hypothetical protein AEA09_15660 [Lysinibacillus contaminans]